jgi:hypothetical protein
MPLLDQHLRLPQRVEDLTVEQLVAQLAVKGFAVASTSITSVLRMRRATCNAMQMRVYSSISTRILSTRPSPSSSPPTGLADRLEAAQ